VRRSVVAACAAALLFVHAAAQPIDLGSPHRLAPGIDLYHLTDPDLLTPPAPLSLWLLRLDSSLVDIRSVLANDAIVGTETVADIATRHAALVAINAGFFLPNGDPAGVLKVNGEVVSDTTRGRGAVGIVPRAKGVGLIFGRLRLSVFLTARMADGRSARVRIDGVDTTRARGRLMLYTPAYHANTDTASGGTEWVVDGSPLRVTSRVSTQGSTSIPRSGYVLSYGGLKPPAALDFLVRGARVRFETSYESADGMAEPWTSARDIVGGAGLLARGGAPLNEWASENLTAGFPETRHPRTAVGTAADGLIWMIVADGRQPPLSVGMNFAELQALGRRLGLTDALNLDGGGSTTLWVQGTIVNSPSDPAGPRKVSDALLVYSRPDKR
jgi:phosphodiester glycosidase